MCTFEPKGEVSIHASVKDATTLQITSYFPACFNPRVREGRDGAGSSETKSSRVSIHASVKDATGSDGAGGVHVPVSIHASVKDATRHRQVVLEAVAVSIHASVKDATVVKAVLDALNGFNPRVREGRDVLMCTFEPKGEVSIHASVKDATNTAAPSHMRSLFQSTRP